MPRCHNCNGYVTQNYVDVFAHAGATGVGIRPHCETDPIAASRGDENG